MTWHAAMNPPPSAGEGARQSRAGERNHVSEYGGTVLTGASWISVALPLSRLTAFATLPRRGGRVHSGAPFDEAFR
ncbi:hypothetical protein mvi_28180 [Methylobacterium indicum]|uniref:Uncharacterized protein n=1 Tax=Methylobacterium indicum TaxID=1775910 RepID=A0A8H8WUB1_9HYPH|nr:hypothetical protein mvi_28180 [Methylobacterium indicum]